ncbi:MAG: hypothetical protein M1816_005719 [Peltula sp. TS41687]|nr:MAG: hypothetical protein M1816_005719 [Peltula sp. TS41687]
MYSDTKQSYDTVTEPPKVDVAPELTSLHRKLRIQKDRLIAWGLEWSDTNAAQPGDIDESLAREGLTDVVGSVMSSIKDILGEAERMRYPEPPVIEREKYGSAMVKDRFPSVDRARFEDLLHDLTTSIDTLYALSRSRRNRQLKRFNADQPTLPPGPETTSLQVQGTPPKVVEAKIQPSPLLAPQMSARPGMSFLLERSCLKIERETRPSLRPPPYEVVATPSSLRTMGWLKRRVSKTGNGGPDVPALIEYASFDPIYTATGMYFPTTRLDKLAETLHKSEDATMDMELGVLNMVGYFEDVEYHRYGLVYTIPDDISRGLSGPGKPLNAMEPFTLLSTLVGDSSANSSSVPNLEDRFRLSYTVSTTFLQLHAKGIVHQDVSSNNIIFFRTMQDMVTASRREPVRDLRRPYLCSFDVFSELNVDIGPSVHIYRHPLDLRKENGSQGEYRASFDIYGLGLILLEIGLWMPLSSFWKQRYDLPTFKSRIVDIYAKKLGPKCGSRYMRAVESCLSAVDRDLAETRCGRNLNLQWGLYCDVVRRLEQCCAIDEGELPSLPADLRLQQPATDGKMPSEMSFSGLKSSMPDPQTGSFTGKASSQTSERQELSTAAQQTPTSQADTSLDSHVLTLDMGTGQVQVPVDEQAASKEADHKRKRNAGASARFRERRIEKEQEAALKIAQLEQQIRDLSALTHPSASTKGEDKASKSPSLRPDMQHAPLDEVSTQQPAKQKPPTSLQEPTTIKGSNTSSPENKTPKSSTKTRPQPVKQSTDQITKEWHLKILPQLERLMEKALKDPMETFTIDLIAIEENVQTTRPTICVTCSSVGKVRSVLSRRFNFDRSTFGLKVRPGKLRRSANKHTRRKTLPPPRRSAADLDHSGQKYYIPQLRPLSGASIGAYQNEEHGNAVTLGGVVLVDGEPYGMTVHHLLDDNGSEDEDSQSETEESPTRSSAPRTNQGWMNRSAQQEVDNPFYSVDDDDSYSSDLSAGEDLSSIAESDDDYEWSEDEVISDDDDGESQLNEPGDIPGVARGEGDGLIVTHPAFDDVDPKFFPSEEDKDEEHLLSNVLGWVYASSGIRRLKKKDGKHEIDWALLKIKDDRLQPHNLIQGGRRHCPNGNWRCPPRGLLHPICRYSDFHPDEDLYPNEVAGMYELGNLEVHCIGRTSGLETGVISPFMSSVRIIGRATASRSWRVFGRFGMAGDSGAWVIDNEKGRVCGHVLAWCTKNEWAYICPMQILLEDIQRTLNAERVELPDAGECVTGSTDVIVREEEENSSSSLTKLTIEGEGQDEDMVTAMVSNLRIASTSPVEAAERSGANMNVLQQSGGGGTSNRAN